MKWGVTQFLTKLNTPYKPAISLLHTYPEEMRTHSHRGMNMNIHRSLIHKSPKLKPIQMPTSVQWNTTQQSNEEEWTAGTCSKMDGSQRFHAKWKKPDLKRLHSLILFVWNSRKWKTNSDRREILGWDHRLVYRVLKRQDHHRDTKESYWKMEIYQVCCDYDRTAITITSVI